MKKILFLASLAAVAMTSCTSESNEYVEDNTPKEIAFKALAQKPTRAAITDGVFPTTETMQVAAYDVTHNRTFFVGTTFTYNNAGGAAASSGHWGGNPAQYWPLEPVYINFLAYANVQGSASFDNTTPASAATINMTDNSVEQKDLMYARANAEVTGSVGSLSIPATITLPYVHAQSLIVFNIQASDAGSATSVALTDIKINNAYFSGTYNITHANYNQNTGQSASGSWTTSNTNQITSVTIPGSTGTTLSTTSSSAGSIMVVPLASGNSFDNFTITYTIGGQSYTYTYTPASLTLAQNTKYVYNITFTAHEIFIDANVSTWSEGTGGSVTIGQ